MQKRGSNPSPSEENKSSGKWFLRELLPELLLGIGIFSLLVSGVHWHLKNRALSLDAELVRTYQQQPQKQEVIPVHIEIPWFVDVPIDEEIYDNGNWTISENNASYLSQSARPGENGNVIIYGHNKREILGNIRALKGGETITLTLSDGSTRDYVVDFLKEVSPTEVQYLHPTDTETLTIYTCSGWLDSKRFIVQAKPV
jgi:sortase (surface protein transpeptidase)